MHSMIVESCVTYPYIIRSGVTHDCTVIDSSCYEDFYSYDFSHCASLHLPSFDKMIFAIVLFVCSQSTYQRVGRLSM